MEMMHGGHDSQLMTSCLFLSFVRRDKLYVEIFTSQISASHLCHSLRSSDHKQVAVDSGGQCLA